MRYEYYCANYTNPQVFRVVRQYKQPALGRAVNSGLPSGRINLSPFTKDFRAGGHTMSVH